jgi:methionyl-tRNA formyltransferase
MAALRVLLVAEEAAGLQALKLLADTEHEVMAVLSRSGAAGEAERLGVPVADPARVTDAAFAARAAEADLLLNIHSLHIAAAEVAAAPRIGGFNLHPGPLPEYAGLNAPSWAILAEETRHAVTLHWMEPEVDAGPIAYAAEFDIEPDDTGLGLSAKCVRQGLPLVGRLLADAPDVPRQEQDLSRRRWHGPGAPYGGRVPWAQPAHRIAALTRAADYSPFPSPWGHPVATIGDRELELVRASSTGEPTGEPPGSIGTGSRVAAGDEWLVVERLRERGKRADVAQVLIPGARFDVNDDHE